MTVKSGIKPKRVTINVVCCCRDPRQGGGKLTKRTAKDVVQLVKLGSKEYLWYKAPRIDVALIRGSTADVDGNVTFEREAFVGDALNMVSSSTQ